MFLHELWVLTNECETEKLSFDQCPGTPRKHFKSNSCLWDSAQIIDTSFAPWLAMPFDKTALENLGGTEQHKGKFRAHLEFRDEKGAKNNIYSTSRATNKEAQKDLDQIRAAGAVGSTREEGLNYTKHRASPAPNR